MLNNIDVKTGPEVYMELQIIPEPKTRSPSGQKEQDTTCGRGRLEEFMAGKSKIEYSISTSVFIVKPTDIVFSQIAAGLDLN